MKKQTIAFTLLIALTSGTAFAKSDCENITSNLEICNMKEHKDGSISADFRGHGTKNHIEGTGVINADGTTDSIIAYESKDGKSGGITAAEGGQIKVDLDNLSAEMDVRNVSVTEDEKGNITISDKTNKMTADLERGVNYDPKGTTHGEVTIDKEGNLVSASGTGQQIIDEEQNRQIGINDSRAKKNATDISNNHQRTIDNKDEIKQNKREIDTLKGDQNKTDKTLKDHETRIGDTEKKVNENNTRSKENAQRITDEISAGKQESETTIRATIGEFEKQDAIFASQQNSITANANAIQENKQEIANLRNDLVKQGEEMKERYDGVKATMHAVTNARPVAYDVGEFAIGAGIGAAGSKQALAIGGAYRFNESWSGSFTTAYETAGKQTKADLSAGVGVHYSFK
ncbi:YadA C-terminal domain-containing protein [Vibrio mediterranei]|uniref:Trimeric autotransporter adhesin YadA-like C-terminal membrane anchor domain-containing protein n=1 Tax=Vibrio mediterranei TaxID=689 RepID=A0A3G4VIZ9_9VIBR|nr:YadA C-terminal domain-containing protein [Vibrio mediterranei]AYV24179.1 hypothetical protein ECB94_23215 [Vibrio mediterranei]